MKRLFFMAFPVLFALLPLGLFLFLYRPAPASPEMTSACLVFLTALGWCSLIVFGHREKLRFKTFYAFAALLASVLIIGVFRPFPVLPRHHALMVVLQALGAAGIVLYQRILKNKGE
jgi:hypothetical protein